MANTNPRNQNMDRAKLLALADRVESATGPDRELDCLICVAVNAGSLPGAHKAMSDDAKVIAAGYVQHHYNGGKSLQEARRYTASIYAALTLASGIGVLISLSEIKGDGMPMCIIVNPATAELFEAVADTMPLAICAASLRALAQQENSDADV